MLPNTIDQLLALTPPDPHRSPIACWTKSSMLSGHLCLVLLLSESGNLEICETLETGLDTIFIDGLAEKIIDEMKSRDEFFGAVQAPTGARELLAVRTPMGIVACLIQDRVKSKNATPEGEEIAATVCGILSKGFFEIKSREGEWRARHEQLTSSHEVLNQSHANNLAKAIEEHEQRITERNVAERELRRLNECNRLILDSVAEGIVGLDEEGRVTFANPAAERMVGRNSEEMVGHRLHDLLHHTHASGAPYLWTSCPVLQTLQDGITRTIPNDFFWRQDGNAFPVEFVVTAMFDRKTIVGAALTFQDVTQRRLWEGQVLQSQKLESIGQLAAGIAHEINTPTQFICDNLHFLEDAFGELEPVLSRSHEICSEELGIEGRASQLKTLIAAAAEADLEYLNEEIPRAIAQSIEGVNRVANIVRSMKEFSHPDTDEMQPIDLNNAIQNTLTVCRNEWKYVAEVVTELDPDLPVVHCLPAACNQVFLNLIINAAHAISDRLDVDDSSKGTITVRTNSTKEWVEVQVSDNGTGIALKNQSKVFDPFFTTKEVGRGTGQGLAISRSVMVDRHGGSLTFETEIGRGTTFFVRLPREPVEASEGGLTDE
jgi:PAS domain S-box-containing protein